ncbi:MAG: hypothetical protein KatS3mg033_0703 [Thermonema sp.]|uniref:anti-sigma factor domain-containing protein n=1 Tax=Thermonema sp. TaxID=2231181 RepID=UPI0021DD8D01|nr:anti-sigma factor [Thermonema sp.]GIV38903.1 MAG: hypothetical protein KatS3mg033_0703 [Thermonema sp.]
MKHEVSRFLASGQMELYILGLLDEKESQKVEKMMERHPELQSVYSEMKSALDYYADKQIQTHCQKEKRQSLPYQQPVQSRVLPQGRRLWTAAMVISVIFNVLLFFFYLKERKANEELVGQMQSMEQRFLAQSVQMQDEYRVLLHAHTYFVPLYRTPGDAQQKAVVVWNRQTGEGFVFSAWLSPPPEGYCYRLWAVDAQGRAHQLTDLQLHRICRTKASYEVSSWKLTLEQESGSGRQVVAQAAMKG